LLSLLGKIHLQQCKGGATGELGIPITYLSEKNNLPMHLTPQAEKPMQLTPSPVARIFEA